MPKKVSSVEEPAASPSRPAASTPAYRRSLPRILEEERAEIIRSIRFTRGQIDYLSRVAGVLTVTSGRAVSISEVVRQLIDEKMGVPG